MCSNHHHHGIDESRHDVPVHGQTAWASYQGGTLGRERKGSQRDGDRNQLGESPSHDQEGLLLREDPQSQEWLKGHMDQNHTWMVLKMALGDQTDAPEDDHMVQA